MTTIFALLTAAAAAATPAPAVQGDTLEAIRQVDFLLLQRYRETEWSSRGGRRDRDALGRPFEVRCDGDRDDVCFGGDPDAGRCPNFVPCHSNPRRLLDRLLESTREHPESGYLLGQTVYLLGKAERMAEALELADACRAAPWWCEAMRGYALHGMGREAEADAALRHALDQAPDSVACALTDATWVLGTWSQRGARTSVPDARRDTEAWDCRRRTAVADTVWWLSDPLHGAPGNPRWVEHVARALDARFHLEILEALPVSAGPESYLDHLVAGRVRRGAVDSYESNMGTSWTSRAAARYHFVPDVAPDGLDRPEWRLEADLDDEGYTPARGPFSILPHQIARFRDGTSLRVAAATRLTDSPVRGAVDAAAALVLTDGPRSRPHVEEGDARASTARFLARVPPSRWIASLEVVTSKGVGWARRALPPWVDSGREISDLLLFDPADSADGPPADLEAAAALMRGSTSVDQGSGIGVYWEVYGARPGAALDVELEVERASGGLVERLTRLLPGATGGSSGRIAWTETATAGTHASAVSLDLRELDEGDYTLVLRVGWGGEEPLERRRAFTVAD